MTILHHEFMDAIERADKNGFYDVQLGMDGSLILLVDGGYQIKSFENINEFNRFFDQYEKDGCKDGIY